MHSLELGGWVAHFNGDFSGEVELRAPGSPTVVTMVPYSLLEAIVAEKIRRQRIAALEDETPGVLLYGR